MRSINKVILMGNLTRDPEMRQTPQGQYVCTFTIATNREWITTDNRKEKSVEFHDCVAWARLAEVCHQYLRKGKLVYVEGHLKTRSWDTPEGLRTFKTEIVVQDMIMLEKRPREDADFIPVENGADEMVTSRTHQSLEVKADVEMPMQKKPVSIESDLGL